MEVRGTELKMTTPTSTSTPKSSSKPKRSSLGRPTTPKPRAYLNTKSTPDLSTQYIDSQRPPIPPIPITHQQTKPSQNATNASRRKRSLGTPSRLSQATRPNDLEPDNSPTAMYSSKPAAPRNVIDDRNGNQNLQTGDVVDVPGGMHGTIRFIGEVRGKHGIFAGVELSREWAARGKNDGDVDGIKYFNTAIKGAGIFLPSSKAYKRPSQRLSQQVSAPSTPNATSLTSFNLGGRGEAKTSTTTTPALGPKFSQSVGPGRSGARSPELKTKSRPSLPRPESPLRKSQNPASTPGNRPSIGNPKLAKSLIGAPKYAQSPTPGRFGASVSGAGQAGDPGKKAPVTPKPSLKKGINGVSQAMPDERSESRNELGPEPMFDSESDNTPVMASKSNFVAKTAQARSRPLSGQDDEIRQLRSQLADRDKQLEKQAADLEEMQNSVNELASGTPLHGSGTATRSSRGSGLDELDTPSLRALVREKNDKIRQLTEEFDSHRADFRDTIDILEHTSDETNRLHQEKIDNLQTEIRELHERIERSEDIEEMTQTLRQLDEQVQELEEGLEDARRGEAEARGEAEFLRGEVERGKAELDREKQRPVNKGTQGGLEGGVNPADLMRDLKRRDDEIKGLRAIIHSLNQAESADKGSPRSSRHAAKKRDSNQTQSNGQISEQQLAEEKLEKDVKELQNLVDKKTYREEELEHEVERLRKSATRFSSNSNGYSEYTARPTSTQRVPESRNASIDWNERGSPTAKFRGSGGLSNTTIAPSASTLPSTVTSISRNQVQPTPESDSHSTTLTDGSNLWCDLCDTAGHDILSCINMMGGGPNNLQQQNKHGRQGSSYSRKQPSYTSPRRASHDREDDYSLETDHRYRSPPRSVPTSAPMASPPAAPAATSAIKQDPAVLSSTTNSKAAPIPAPLPQASRTPNLADTGLVAGKASGVVDGDKWCAMCERDGHDATDCPFEGEF